MPLYKKLQHMVKLPRYNLWHQHLRHGPHLRENLFQDFCDLLDFFHCVMMYERDAHDAIVDAKFRGLGINERVCIEVPVADPDPSSI